MAGIVLEFDGNWGAHRVLRDDVLQCLYGKASADPRRLIDEALQVLLAVAIEAGDAGISAICPVMGLHAGEFRTTEALSAGDAIRQAVLLYSSHGQLEGWDELEESDTPSAEEVNKRFTTEVREAVFAVQPFLVRYFGRNAQLVPGGRPVKFGYVSERSVLHFSVLHPVRQANGVRDARARLWELYRAKEVAGFQTAALITAVPRDDDPTLGRKQRDELRNNRIEIENEADIVRLRLFPVTSPAEAAHKVLELA